MDLAAVMDQITNRIATVLPNAFGYPAPTVTPPAAVMAYPQQITFDETYGRGMDRMDPTVWIVVGKTSERTTRDRLAAYCAGSGPSSIKQTVESGTYTAFDTVRVVAVHFDEMQIGATGYMAAGFELDIAGHGS